MHMSKGNRQRNKRKQQKYPDGLFPKTPIEMGLELKGKNGKTEWIQNGVDMREELFESFEECFGKSREFEFYWNQYLEYTSRFTDKTRQEVVDDLIEKLGCKKVISELVGKMSKDNVLDAFDFDDGTSPQEFLLSMIVVTEEEFEPFVDEIKQKVQTQYLEDNKEKNNIQPENDYLN